MIKFKPVKTIPELIDNFVIIEGIYRKPTIEEAITIDAVVYERKETKVFYEPE